MAISFPGEIPIPRGEPYPIEPVYGSGFSDAGKGLRQTGLDIDTYQTQVAEEQTRQQKIQDMIEQRKLALRAQQAEELFKQKDADFKLAKQAADETEFTKTHGLAKDKSDREGVEVKRVNALETSFIDFMNTPEGARVKETAISGGEAGAEGQKNINRALISLTPYLETKAGKQLSEQIKNASYAPAPNQFSGGMTPVDTDLEKKYNTVFLAWTAQGGGNTTKLAAQQLISSGLALPKYSAASGGFIGAIPLGGGEALSKRVSPEGAAHMQTIKLNALAGIKNSLGSQFTEKDRIEYVNNYFDISLPEEINGARAWALGRALQIIAGEKDKAANWRAQHGRISDYPGFSDFGKESLDVLIEQVKNDPVYLQTFGEPKRGTGELNLQPKTPSIEDKRAYVAAQKILGISKDPTVRAMADQKIATYQSLYGNQ